MDEQTKKKRRKLLTIASVAALLCVVAFMVYSGLVLKEITVAYYIVVGAGIGLFWLIEQVLTPLLTDGFSGKTPEQISAYRLYALLGLAGYAGLVYFAVSFNQQTGVYGALVYVVTMIGKRKLYERWTGEAQEEQDQQEQIEESAQEQTLDIPAPGLEADASTRRERMQAAEGTAARVARLNALADEIDEIKESETDGSV